MNNSYLKVKPGKLNILGSKHTGKHHSSHKKHHQSDSLKPEIAEKELTNEEVVAPTTGIGRIITSQCVVTGMDTKFISQLHPGDAILIEHPASYEQEVRVVKSVLCDTSCSIGSPFSSDIISSLPYEILLKPKQKTDEETEKEKKQSEALKEEELAFGEYTSHGGSSYTYSTRLQSAYGGLKTVTIKTKKPLTREQQLDIRCKNKSDRHCM
ncbi:hypothetical protein WA158_001681 [Blastocystis sp. Blastoise]